VRVRREGAGGASAAARRGRGGPGGSLRGEGLRQWALVAHPAGGAPCPVAARRGCRADAERAVLARPAGREGGTRPHLQEGRDDSGVEIGGRAETLRTLVRPLLRPANPP